jgi:hypothetical protein
MGYHAAYNVTNGSDTIKIFNVGAPNDKSLIRLAMQGTQTEEIIVGIDGSTVTVFRRGLQYRLIAEKLARSARNLFCAMMREGFKSLVTKSARQCW